MVNYANAKVYRIIDNSTGLQYIGSTTQPLAKRMHDHRQEYKRWVGKERPRGKGSGYLTSFEVFETGNEVRIELIEKPEVTCREELGAREGHWIREIVGCVNKNVAGRTSKEYNKEWYEANRERCRAKAKERWEANKEAIAERDKRWKKEAIRCEVCGATVTKGNYAAHKKAKYCLEAAAAKAAQDDSDL